MSWLTIIGGILQLLLLLISRSIEVSTEKKKEKESIIKELGDAIKNNDPSAVTLALGKLQ